MVSLAVQWIIYNFLQMCCNRLSGRVHAGSQGNLNANISALELRGAHLEIARVKSLAAARVSNSRLTAFLSVRSEITDMYTGSPQPDPACPYNYLLCSKLEHLAAEVLRQHV